MKLLVTRLNEPHLRRILQAENDVNNEGIDIVCVMNRLVYCFLLIKWINFEFWWLFGDGPFTMHR